jgi:hypothetical protein
MYRSLQPCQVFALFVVPQNQTPVLFLLYRWYHSVLSLLKVAETEYTTRPPVPAIASLVCFLFLHFASDST